MTSLDALTVGELRRVLNGGVDESLTIAEALDVLAAGERAQAEHAEATALYTAYVERRTTRLQVALEAAARKANDAAKRSDGDGARMAARQAARLETSEDFERSEPLLEFHVWMEAGQPETYTRNVVQRAANRVMELVS